MVGLYSAQNPVSDPNPTCFAQGDKYNREKKCCILCLACWGPSVAAQEAVGKDAPCVFGSLLFSPLCSTKEPQGRWTDPGECSHSGGVLHKPVRCASPTSCNKAKKRVRVLAMGLGTGGERISVGDEICCTSMLGRLFLLWLEAPKGQEAPAGLQDGVPLFYVSVCVHAPLFLKIRSFFSSLLLLPCPTVTCNSPEAMFRRQKCWNVGPYFQTILSVLHRINCVTRFISFHFILNY